MSSRTAKGERHQKRPSASGEESRQVLLCGRKPVLELLRHRQSAIEEILLSDAARFDEELTDRLQRSAIPVRKEERESFEQIVGDDRHHQGIAARVRPSEAIALGEAAARGVALGLPLLVAEHVSDPQNLGSLFRAAEALGCAAILITKDRSAAVNQTVRRVSSGASELLPFSYVGNLQRALSELKRAGYWVIGTALGEESVSLYEAELPGPCVVVLGAEGRGLRELTKKNCDLLIRVPMTGVTQSLNVGQAGAVVLHELARRRSCGAK